MNGFVGRLLRIDLTKRTSATEPLNMEWARQYLGCSGIGARYLYEELAAGADALGAENKLIISTGPLTGTTAAGCPKYAIVTKSPLSGGFIDSTAGGGFGPELKYAGYDLVIIEGEAESPVYVTIRDGSVEIKDAYRLWGKTVTETEDSLREWFGPRAEVLSIGPAGENLVKFASVMTGYHRAHGRGGVGAVFGAKKLKAMVVQGSGSVEVASAADFAKAAKRALMEGLIDNPGAVWASRPRGGGGTQELMPICNDNGLLATRNYSAGTFGGSERIGLDASKAIISAFRACTHCPVACKGHVHLDDPRWGDVDGECPEFESWALLGANCCIDDLPAVVKANALCNDLGMDTMSAGNAISWAMECQEKGLLDEWAGGSKVSFGDAGAALGLLEDIAARRGLGDLLADGVKNASEKVGGDSDRFAMHVKGMGLPAYDPRAAVGMGLGYATASVGAHHTRAFTLYAELWGLTWLGADPVELDPYSPEHKGKLVAQMQNFQTYRFNTGACDFVYGAVNEGWLTDLVVACTGWPEAGPGYAVIGERFHNLTRLFNLREGLSRADDRLPRRLLEEPLPDGPSEGHRVEPSDFETMLDAYYAYRGWDEQGRPTPEKLQQLGIAELAS